VNKNYFIIVSLLFLISCTAQEKNVSWCASENCQELREIKQTKVKENGQKQIYIVVVIDVFRAFSTAAYVLDRYPAYYIFAKKSDTISRIAVQYSQPLLIGKAEIGANLNYHIPNSPTRSLQIEVTGKNIFHRTEAGAKGVLLAKDADIILVASFVNSSATARYIRKFPKAKVIIMPMGHEGNTPTLEDSLCGQYIVALINGRLLNIKDFFSELKQGSGKYFFGKDQSQYPSSDFNLCLDVNRFNFPICAYVKDDYAILSRCN
jgi:2-phosphosulfolactate phosphatase